MLPPKATRDLAQSLIAGESETSTASLHTEPASVRVYEKLRRQLSVSMGSNGFQALASRALVLAKSDSPQLRTVQITANGGLLGLCEVESKGDIDGDGEVGLLLIAQLLGLFLNLLGEKTTLRLIEDLRLQMDADIEAPATAEDLIFSAADGPEMAAAFEGLLLEIDRLRKVSDRIEALAGGHLGMEDGLVNVAGNIRSIATLLDVFVLIRSKAGGSQEDGPDPETNLYMN